MGIVTTLLFWFYLGGLIVAAATLNAEFTELRAAKRVGRGVTAPSDEVT